MYFSGGHSCYNLVLPSTSNKTLIFHTLASIVVQDTVLLLGLSSRGSLGGNLFLSLSYQKNHILSDRPLCWATSWKYD